MNELDISNRTDVSLVCTVSYLGGFPYDADSNGLMLAKTETQLKALPTKRSECDYRRVWIAILCSQQKKSRALLEQYGFRCLIETKSGHREVVQRNNVNGGTIYVMFREID